MQVQFFQLFAVDTHPSLRIRVKAHENGNDSTLTRTRCSYYCNGFPRCNFKTYLMQNGLPFIVMKIYRFKFDRAFQWTQDFRPICLALMITLKKLEYAL